MARRDGIAALVLLLVAGAVSHQAAALPFGSVTNPGPGFVPWWTGLTLAGLALVLATQALRALRAPGARRARAVPAGDWRRVVRLLVALGLYALALDPLGYPISTFLLVLLMRRPTSGGALLSGFALALLASGGTYLLFAVWLGVPLPPGPLLR